MKIVIATRNAHKATEIKSLFSISGIDVVSLDQLDPDGKISEVEETGKTLQENAFLKARTIHAATGLAAVADDTGLEVKALGGDPGVYSARYAGEHCSYEDNVRKLLENIDSLKKNQLKLKSLKALLEKIEAYIRAQSFVNINTSIKLPLTISINAAQHKKVQILENCLDELDLVSNFEILRLNNNNIYFKIIYNGSPNRFISEIKTKGIKINTQNQIWEVQ